MRLNRTGMRVITFIIVDSFFITLIATASAADFYYVATTGSDEGDGSADKPWRTIQHAVDNDSVSDGDTINVHDGTYTENVEVGKSLTIRSDNGSAVTTVQADETVFAINADYVNISGFTITGATDDFRAGIGLEPTKKHCTISNNTISGNNFGISLYNSDYNNITKNIIANNSDGIRLEGSRYNTITCNWIHHNNNGSYLAKTECPLGLSTNNTIERNNIIANGEYNETTGGWEWQFYNDQTANVEALDNWWGTVDEVRINASIFDKYDDETRGIVNFSHRSGPAPCAPVPESAPILLFGLGLLALAGYVLRERRL